MPNENPIRFGSNPQQGVTKLITHHKVAAAPSQPGAAHLGWLTDAGSPLEVAACLC